MSKCKKATECYLGDECNLKAKDAIIAELQKELATMRKVVGLMRRISSNLGFGWLVYDDAAKAAGLDIDALLKRLK